MTLPLHARRRTPRSRRTTGRHTDHALVQIEIKNVKQIVAEAQQQVEAITAEAPAEEMSRGGLTLVDLREHNERELHGVISFERPCAEGMLEFCGDPSSAAHSRSSSPARGSCSTVHWESVLPSWRARFSSSATSALLVCPAALRRGGCTACDRARRGIPGYSCTLTAARLLRPYLPRMRRTRAARDLRCGPGP